MFTFNPYPQTSWNPTPLYFPSNERHLSSLWDRGKVGCGRWTYKAANEGFVHIRFSWQGRSAYWFIIWHPYYYSQCFVIRSQTWLEFVITKWSMQHQCLWVGGAVVLFKLSSVLASPHDVKATYCGHVKWEDSFIHVWIRVWFLQAVCFMMCVRRSQTLARQHIMSAEPVIFML